MEQFSETDLTPAELELRGIKIDPTHRQDEPELMQRRWFDYRDMHPVLATYEYARCYKTQTRKFYEMNIDIRTVEDARAFTPDDIFMSRDITAMWLARRAADALGVPYPFILQFAQDRFLSRAQRTFPRPNQLYGEEFELDAKAEWGARLDRQITYGSTARYLASSYKRHPYQDEHIDFLIKQVARRQGSKHRLLARLFHEDRLTPTMAAAHFSEEEVSAAERYREQFM